jgi:hypothetical protein
MKFNHNVYPLTTTGHIDITRAPLNEPITGMELLEDALAHDGEIRRRYNYRAEAPWKLILRVGNKEYRTADWDCIRPYRTRASMNNGSCRVVGGRREDCAKMIDILTVDERSIINGHYYRIDDGEIGSNLS